MRTLRRSFIWAVALLVVLLSTAIALAVAYEDDVKKQLLSEINDKLQCKIDVDKIELTLIERFPKASLKFSNILAYEAIPEKVFPDTLLHAEQLYLEFSIFDLLGSSYTVQNILLRNAEMDLVKYPDGTPNYNIWKKSEESGSESSIELEKVLLENVNIAFADSVKSFYTALALNNTTVSADMNEQLYFDIRSDLQIGSIRSGGDTLALQRQVRLETEFSFNKENDQFDFARSKLVLENVPLFVQGTVNTGDEPNVDLNISGDRLTIADLRSLLPDNLQATIRPYGLAGKASFEGSVNGPIGAGYVPTLSAEFELSDAKMTELTTRTVFDRINSSGRFVVSKETIDLYLNETKARSGPGIAKVKGWIKDLNSPEFELELSAEMDMEAIQGFFRIEDLENVDGDLDLNARVSGNFKDPSDITRKDLQGVKASGQLVLSDATIKMKGREHGLENMNGTFILHNNDAAIQGLHASLAGSDLELNGFFRNLLPHLLVKGERLAVEAQFYSELTDLNGLLETKEQTDKKERSYHLKFPEHIDLNLNAQIDKLVFRDFQANEINGIIRLVDDKLYADPVTFGSSGGNILAQLVVDGSKENELPLTVSAKVQGIQIDQLFSEFEDFGQDFITSDHLKGNATANVTYKASLLSDLTFDLDKTYCLIDIDIENGELVEHAPLIQVAQYVRKNKLIAPFVRVDELEKDLHHIHFSKLENQIEIKDRTVHVPAMFVETNAMNIELAGSHTFEGYMDHHVNFRISELLNSGKADKEEFGPVVDDGTGSRIYLHMYGKADDLTIESDRDAIKEDRKEYLANEKEQLKSILKEEFGLFNKDTSLVYQEKDPDKPVFIVEWEEGDSLKTEQNPNDKKKKKSWLDRLVLEDPEKASFEDDDDF